MTVVTLSYKLVTLNTSRVSTSARSSSGSGQALARRVAASRNLGNRTSQAYKTSDEAASKAAKNQAAQRNDDSTNKLALAQKQVVQLNESAIRSGSANRYSITQDDQGNISINVVRPDNSIQAQSTPTNSQQPSGYTADTRTPQQKAFEEKALATRAQELQYKEKFGLKQEGVERVERFSSAVTLGGGKPKEERSFVGKATQSAVTTAALAFVPKTYSDTAGQVYFGIKKQGLYLQAKYGLGGEYAVLAQQERETAREFVGTQRAEIVGQATLGVATTAVIKGLSSETSTSLSSSNKISNKPFVSERTKGNVIERVLPKDTSPRPIPNPTRPTTSFATSARIATSEQISKVALKSDSPITAGQAIREIYSQSNRNIQRTKIPKPKEIPFKEQVKQFESTVNKEVGLSKIIKTVDRKVEFTSFESLRNIQPKITSLERSNKYVFDKNNKLIPESVIQKQTIKKATRNRGLIESDKYRFFGLQKYPATPEALGSFFSNLEKPKVIDLNKALNKNYEIYVDSLGNTRIRRTQQYVSDLRLNRRVQFNELMRKELNPNTPQTKSIIPGIEGKKGQAQLSVLKQKSKPTEILGEKYKSSRLKGGSKRFENEFSGGRKAATAFFEDVKPSVREVTLPKIVFAQSPKSSLVPITAIASKQDQKSISSQISSSDSAVIQKQNQRSSFVSAVSKTGSVALLVGVGATNLFTSSKAGSKRREPITRGALGIPSGGLGVGYGREGKGSKQKYAYTPSLTGIEKRVVGTGKATGNTGISVRGVSKKQLAILEGRGKRFVRF